MMISSLLKAAVITLLGLAAIGLTTWGLITKDANPDGVMMAVVGLVAYMGIWSIGLLMIGSNSSA